MADLSDAASLSDLSTPHSPPIPGPLVDAVMNLDVMISRLSGHQQLHTAATQLRITRPTGEHAVLLTQPEPAPQFGQLLPLADDTDPVREPDAASILSALGDNSPELWSAREMAIVRVALRLHLADIGDGFLRISEWTGPPLTWREERPGVLTATHPVNSAAHDRTARRVRGAVGRGRMRFAASSRSPAADTTRSPGQLVPSPCRW
ncbi:hypothetical protein [Nocardia xishanensis]